MPQATPIYSFPYPCEGEDITVASFANLANAIDAKLQDISNDAFEARSRYNFGTESASNVIPVGIDTALTGTDSTYTIPADGVYLIRFFANTSAEPTTFTSERIRVRKNGVVQFGVRQNPEVQFMDFSGVGMITAAAGDVISFIAAFSGTGTWTLSLKWYIAMFVRIQ